MSLKQQHMAARTRHLFRTVARLATVCGGALLLSACVSGTSADLACKSDSAANALTGDIKSNVVVPRNATCYLKANITGDVNAQDGARIYVLDGTHISGSFRAVGAALVRFNLDGASAAASGRLGRAAPARIYVGSNLVVKESHLIGESGIAATEIGGNLVILRNADGGAGGIASNEGHASFNVCTPGMCRPEASVRVGKSVKIRQNSVVVALNYTSIGADLKCASNDHAPVLMKSQAGAGRVTVKGRKSGQCEHLREVVTAPPPPAVATPGSAAPVPKA
jgi:hypothetical protein